MKHGKKIIGVLITATIVIAGIIPMCSAISVHNNSIPNEGMPERIPNDDIVVYNSKENDTEEQPVDGPEEEGQNESNDNNGDGDVVDPHDDNDGDGYPNAGLDGEFGTEDDDPDYDPEDRDGDGIPNQEDNDMDGDGIANPYDDDIDGDGLDNDEDQDDDGDGYDDFELLMEPGVCYEIKGSPIVDILLDPICEILGIDRYPHPDGKSTFPRD